MEPFQEAWAQAYCRKLNESEAYRRAAATWEGSLALAVASPSSPERNRSKAMRTNWASETPNLRARSFKSRSWSSLK